MNKLDKRRVKPIFYVRPDLQWMQMQRHLLEVECSVAKAAI